jgi:alpha-L-rhamnosidase
MRFLASVMRLPATHSFLFFVLVFSQYLPVHAKAGESGNASPVTVSELRCEYQKDPLGINTLRPRLSWKLLDQTFTRSQGQTAYQILVAADPAQLQGGLGPVWDSGKVTSHESFNVEYNGPALNSGHDYYWKVKVWDKDDRQTSWSPAGRFVVGLLQPSDWTGQWIALGTAADENQTWLRKSFSIQAPAKTALLRVASAGYQEVYVNGKKLTEDVLTPNHYDLTKRIPYRTYDISPYLKAGDNVVALWLAPGFSIFRMNGEYTNQLPKRPLCKIQMNAVLSNGQPFELVSDAGWKCHLSSGQNIGEYKNSNFGGESIDDRADLPGWNNTGFDDSAWVAATVYPLQRDVLPDMVPPDRVLESIPAQSVTRLGPNKFRVDFGRIFAGWTRIHLPPLPAGTTVTFKAASVLDQKANNEVSPVPDPECEYNQKDELICNGNPKGETFCNHFNYHLIRYLVIEGLLEAPLPSDIHGLSISNDTPRLAAFDCSNQLVDTIYNDTLNTNRILTVGGMSVDCQNRERGAYGVSAMSALPRMTTYESGAFYTKVTGDWMDIMEPDGSTHSTAPTNSGDEGSALFSGLTVLLPWEMYLTYRDTRILQENYPQMKLFMGFLARNEDQNDLLNLPNIGSVGDWNCYMGPNWRQTDKSLCEPVLFNNSFVAYLNKLMSRIATVLGNKEDAATYARAAQASSDAVNKAFYNSSTATYFNNAQSNLIMPLVADIVPSGDEAKVLHQLEQRINVDCKGHLETGEIGTYWMTRYLAEHDRSDLVFTYATQTTMPGYGYFIGLGMKTWAEYWGLTWGAAVHACGNGIWAWYQEGLAGVRYDADQPGYQTFILDPSVAGNISWVKSSYDLNYGKIVSNWSVTGPTFCYDIEVPPNTTATVYLPTVDSKQVLEGGLPVEIQPGIRLLGSENGREKYAVESGKYHFTVTPYTVAH